MAMFGLNQDKLIESLFALPKEKALREGDFSLTLQDEHHPGLSISLRIREPERTPLPVQPATPVRDREAPQETAVIRTYYTSSYFLEQCHTALFHDSPTYERQFFLSGIPRGEEAYDLDLLIPVILDNPSRYGVEADLGDLLAQLSHLDLAHGLLLLGIIHSHLSTGRGAAHPSQTDRRLQENLEASGYKTVQAIFSEDGYIGFFTNTIPFALHFFTGQIFNSF